MGRLALVGGASLEPAALPRGEWEVWRRHGDRDGHVLPHDVDHVAAMQALVEAGCDRVLALASVGGLRAALHPGTLLCPDDFIALDAPPLTSLRGEAAHRVPGFDSGWRSQVVAGVRAAGAEVVDGGTYWQATGPRLETPAEIRLIAPHADVIGMTIGSECVVAGELGLRYAALCVVDNLANGIGEAPLTLDEIRANRARNEAALADLLAHLLPCLGG